MQGITLVHVVWFFLLLVGGTGWVMNIFDIVAVINDPVTAFLVLRIVGIFVFPLGAVLGYF